MKEKMCPKKTDCATKACTTTTDGCPMKQCTVDDENMFAEAKKKCSDSNKV